MKFPVTFRMWFVAGVVSLLLASTARGVTLDHPSVLVGVKGLDKTVTCTETKIPLGELIKKVTADTGVKLTAAAGVADEPVAVVVKDFPARCLLEQLADLLNYTWSRHEAQGETRFELYQDLASKQREVALRRAVQDEIEERFWAGIRRMGEMAAMTPEALQRLIEPDEQQEKALRELPWDQRVAIANSPAGIERTERLQMAQTLVTPVGKTLGRFLGQLSPREWALLEQQGTLFLSSAPRPGELPLPPKIEAGFRDARIAPSEPDPEVEEEARRSRSRDEWATAAGHRVSLQLSGDPQGGRELRFWAVVQPLTQDKSEQPSYYAGLPGTQLRLDIRPDDVSLPAGGPAPPSREALEKDPVLGVRKLFRPRSEVRLTPFGPRKEEWWRLQELLPELARTFDVNFISDAYFASRDFVSVRALTGRSLALADLLTEVLGHMQGPAPNWDRRGNLIRLRSRTWFLDRPREVPLRLVRRWKSLCDRQGVLSLDEDLQMVTTLTDDQLAGLSDVGPEVGFPPPMYQLYPGRYALRLYAALTAEQRQVLAQGAALPVARMTPAQHALLLAQMRAPNPNQVLWRMTAPTAAEGLALTSDDPYVLRRERHGGITTFYREDDHPLVRTTASSRATRGAEPQKDASEEPVTRCRIHPVTFWVVTGSAKQPLIPLDVPAEP